MKQLIYQISALCGLFFYFTDCVGQTYPKVALAGDYPDPTIVRDGKDYYMTHSPFLNAPGLLIWHSTDLEHWEPVCRALPDVPGLGYAPDLVEYKGRFYIYFPASGTNYVIWADKITGPWSKPIDLKVGKIDPGHAVGEDGKRYLFSSGGNRIKLTDDGLATEGIMENVYTGWDFPKKWQTEGKWLESPKIIKHGEYFYLTCAEGGTAGPPTSHMVISARSKNINGPWENSPYNPIVHTYSADEPWWSKGHGTLIDDVNGNWWIVYHAYKKGFYTLGRYTLVEPIEWTKEGWFKLASRPSKKLSSKLQHSGFNLSDPFAGKDPGLQWTLWRQRNTLGVQLSNNSLYMEGKGTSPANGRILLCIPTDTSYRTEVTIATQPGSTGGLLLFYNDKAFTGITADTQQITFYDPSGITKTFPRSVAGPIRLRIDNHQEHCSFSLSDDGRNWRIVADNIVVSALQHNNYKGFLALRIGLFASGQAQVKFNDFSYSSNKAQ
ncbi:hypothetical protein A4H97_29605 [Niastella yeongjuensis]|uniref:Beta-xylosidase C-terminal Concanavalin A-like domain-containing protein n=1 Tax=Niastella yeongjuensis TaxID=354355 RepID=A0A1V9ESD6_9BACT|nr:family 43 glycosylhydrolase [Niastella yeongjuensis]OQP49036.1 hypothetical protein A4H97_29605 [Niastella yeongjuensis]SEP11052.1 Beta-xylosidase [Niastella yeongjuensis]